MVDWLDWISCRAAYCLSCLPALRWHVCFPAPKIGRRFSTHGTKLPPSHRVSRRKRCLPVAEVQPTMSGNGKGWRSLRGCSAPAARTGKKKDAANRRISRAKWVKPRVGEAPVAGTRREFTRRHSDLDPGCAGGRTDLLLNRRKSEWLAAVDAPTTVAGLASWAVIDDG